MGTAEHHKERSISSSESDGGDEQEEYKTEIAVRQKLARFVVC